MIIQLAMIVWFFPVIGDKIANLPIVSDITNAAFHVFAMVFPEAYAKTDMRLRLFFVVAMLYGLQLMFYLVALKMHAVTLHVIEPPDGVFKRFALRIVPFAIGLWGIAIVRNTWIAIVAWEFALVYQWRLYASPWEPYPDETELAQMRKVNIERYGLDEEWQREASAGRAQMAEHNKRRR